MRYARPLMTNWKLESSRQFSTGQERQTSAVLFPGATTQLRWGARRRTWTLQRGIFPACQPAPMQIPQRILWPAPGPLQLPKSNSLFPPYLLRIRALHPECDSGQRHYGDLLRRGHQVTEVLWLSLGTEEAAFSWLGQRESSLAPTANAAIHGDYPGVTHFLQVVSGEGGAETAAAIEDHGCVEVGNTFLDVALDDSSAQVNRGGEVIFGVFVVFAYVNQQKLLTLVEFRFHLVDSSFLDALFCIVDDAEK